MLAERAGTLYRQPMPSHPGTKHVSPLSRLMPRRILFGRIKQKYHNRNRTSEKLLILWTLLQFQAPIFVACTPGTSCRCQQRQTMDLASAIHRWERGPERIHSIKTVQSNFFSKEYGFDAKDFLRRREAEKTTNFAVIAVHCGFGTFV